MLPEEPQSIAHPTGDLDGVGVGEVVQIRHEGAVAVHKDGPAARPGPRGIRAHGDGVRGEFLTVHLADASHDVANPDSQFPELLAEQWRTAIRRAVGGAPRLAVLYSGGVDSSLVATGAREWADVKLVTVGVHGCADLRAAEEGALLLELPWVHREVLPSDVNRVLSAERTTLAGASLASQSVLIGLAIALETSPESRVICGQGADELFLGYAHFQGLSPDATRARRSEDLRRLQNEDWPRSLSLARRPGRSLASPFLDLEFVEYALGIPVERLREGSGRKPLLRELALRSGVPVELVYRPKRAFQYGSGIQRLLRNRERGSDAPGSTRHDPGAGLVPHRPGEGRGVGDDRSSTAGSKEVQ